MGKRVVTVVAAVLVAGALGVGGAFVASRTGQRAPATLPALQAADGQAASTSGAASAQGTPAAPLPGQRARAPGGGAEPDVVPPQVRYQVRGELPDRGQAERIARDLLARVGAPVDGAELQMVRGLDRWFVSASPRVGDLPTMGLTWTAGVGSKGQVLSASGWLAAPRPADTYPLITVRQALDRLRNRPVGGPVIERQPGDRAPTAVRPAPCQPPSELPARCAAGPVTVDVTGARLGLQLATVLPPVGGSGKIPRSYLVPAYFFQIDGTWTEQVAVIAVQDRFLTAPPSTVVPLRSG